uniref:H15 domain-containing protein n=1 Tax=Romanomermis culicivorax TaxID=13658 RepID=A0A915I9Q2_ROMCU
FRALVKNSRVCWIFTVTFYQRSFVRIVNRKIAMADISAPVVPQSASPAPPAPAKSPKKPTAKTTTKKPKTAGAKKSKSMTPANHPIYSDMITKAIQALKEHKGSSRQAILKYIMANFNVGNDAKIVNSRIKLALKRGVTVGAYKQAKGTGAAGSFRLGEKKAAEAKKKPKTAKAKKVVAPTVEGAVVKPKKTATSKKPKSPKKLKSPKKASSAKPKKVKSPKPKSAKVKPAGSPKKAKAPKKPKSPKKPKAAKSPKKSKTPKKAAAAKKAVPALAHP